MKKKFEDNMAELKFISESLEAGNLDLNDALSLYEKGMKIISECEKELENTESAIRMISHTNDKVGDEE